MHVVAVYGDVWSDALAADEYKVQLRDLPDSVTSHRHQHLQQTEVSLQSEGLAEA